MLKLCISLANLSLASDALRIDHYQKKSKSFPRQWRIGQRLPPFQVVPGHKSANPGPLVAQLEGSGYHLHEHRRLTAKEKRTQQI